MECKKIKADFLSGQLNIKFTKNILDIQPIVVLGVIYLRCFNWLSQKKPQIIAIIFI